MPAYRFVLVTLLLSLAALSLEAQITGEMKGTVTDPSGAAVPSVTVLLTSVETGEGRSVSTDQEGRFAFPLLKIGDYRVEAEAQGFRRAVVPASVRSAEITSVNLKLEVGQVTTFIGRDWTKSVEANWPRFLKVWKPLVQYAEDRDVRIGIENCPMLFTNDEWPGGKNLATSPKIWRRMFEDIPSRHLGLNYDPSHMVWQQMDYIKPLWEFKDRLYHVHAKDVRLDRARLDDVGILATPLRYHTPKLPGLGEINWGRFCSVLGDIGYTGPVCVEVEDRAYEGSLETRKAALQQSAHYLLQYMP